MDTDKTHWEKGRWELHKNIEQILKATTHEKQLFGHFAPISKTIQVRRRGHCWRSLDELISEVFLWTPTRGHASIGRPARTYLHQLSEDTGYSLEDLPETKDWGRKSGKSVLAARLDDDDDDDDDDTGYENRSRIVATEHKILIAFSWLKWFQLRWQIKPKTKGKMRSCFCV